MPKHKSFKLIELEKLLDAKLEGNPDCLVDNISTTLNSNNSSITFVTNKKYFGHIDNCKAAAIIVSKQFEIKDEKNYLVCDDPYAAYARLSNLFSDDHLALPYICLLYTSPSPRD